MAEWYQFRSLRPTIAVIVPTRNRASYLPGCLAGITGQTVRPRRIIVVDDGSTDNTRAMVAAHPGVEYHRADVGNGVSGVHARNVGLSLLNDAETSYVCTIDSDDLVPPNYLERLLGAIEGDCRAAAAYPRVVQFGERTGEFQFPFDPLALGRSNCAPNTSLVRLDALRQIGGWIVPTGMAYEDWATWRRLRDLGWTLVPAPAEYYWRRHAATHTGHVAASLSARWSETINHDGLVTVAIPLCGRADMLEPQAKAVCGQCLSPSQMGIVLYDNSGKAAIRSQAMAIYSPRFSDVRLVVDNTPAIHGRTNSAVADSRREDVSQEVTHRVAAVWNRLGRLPSTDLIWCLEDDIIPARDTLARLLRAMRSDVDAVSACYMGRHRDVVAWDHVSLSPLRTKQARRGVGVEPIGGVGMGCVLARRDIFAAPARSTGDGCNGHIWYDANLWADVARRGGTALIDWDAEVEHRWRGPSMKTTR